eukprot:CAMPEP_0194514488 /NCGR_PEP_ID=MMETSP0253-20130528/46956_1 /TAXON_ID=2966 /ORGANISM="Noctiluca scintillans" /LENGTH=216 /DNA_ID=CAMNT_0039358151 /DNA_START=507 /DNA_END=1157 /DNA_ORIENTATION=+
MLEIFFVLSLVAASILPQKSPLAMHLVQLPMAAKGPAVSPTVEARTMNIVVLEVTIERRPIAPRKVTISRLAATLVLPSINGAIWPHLRPVPVLLVILPLTLVLRAILKDVDPVTVSLVDKPLPRVDAATYVEKFPFTMSLVISPLTVIFGAFRPYLHAMAMPTLAAPFTDVSGTTGKCVQRKHLRSSATLHVVAFLVPSHTVPVRVLLQDTQTLS